MLSNRNDESGHPCLIPDPKEKTVSPLPLNMILAIDDDDDDGDFVDALYQIQEVLFNS